MVFSPEYYRVLIVSSSQSFTDILSRMLLELGEYEITEVTSVAAARRKLLEGTYDHIIINSPLSDDFGTRFAIDAAGHPGTVVLVMVKSELYEGIKAKLTPQGVFTLIRPTPVQTLHQALNWMAAARERLRRTEKKTASIEDKMEEIRLVNRAKWLLIESLKMTEAEAHRHIEKQAMDRCVSKREIALGIIKTYT